MRPSRLFAASALLAVMPACHRHGSQAPDWSRSAPSGAHMAISGRVGWLLERPDFQDLLRRFPLAEQSLELLLKKARITTTQETGRVSFFLMQLQDPSKPSGVPQFLIQLGGFKDPQALQSTLVESFPTEGSLTLHGQDLPLHVILDVQEWKIRALCDDRGRIWLGDLSALPSLAKHNDAQSSLATAAAWIDAKAPLQGFLKLEEVKHLAAKVLPAEKRVKIPQGLDVLAWSVTPAENTEAPYQLMFCLTGTREGIQQAAPWAQRLVAFVGESHPNGRAASAEMVETSNRIGIRAHLSGKQVQALLEGFSTPSFQFETKQHPTP